MAALGVERVPVQLFGLGLLGFDHLQIVFDTGDDEDGWFVLEGLREQQGGETYLAVEGRNGGTTLSDANGGLAGEALAERIGTSASRGAQWIASGTEAVSLWADFVALAADIEDQRLPYIPASLHGSPLPTINSSSLVASLLHHAGVAVETALPSGLRFSPGLSTLIGTSHDDTLVAGHGFTSLLGGPGDDLLIGRDEIGTVDKLYGGNGNDTFRWSPGTNIIHGGQPGLPYASDGLDTVDYSGAGDIFIEALNNSAPHLKPDFIVTHKNGRDQLFSIEEIAWDDAIDRVTVGDGVGLVDRFPKTAGGGDDLPNAHAADFEHSFPAESSLDAPAGG
jgi:Ca2+-binding RTX toxin-like protein